MRSLAVTCVLLVAGVARIAAADEPFEDALYLQANPAADETAADGSSAAAAADHEALAKKLQNPVANLISVPLQYNVDFNGGADGHGERQYLNIQPVIPFSLNENWNVITRTIVPLVYQDGIVDDGGSTQFGLGDTTQSFSSRPRRPGPAE